MKPHVRRHLRAGFASRKAGQNAEGGARSGGGRSKRHLKLAGAKRFAQPLGNVRAAAVRQGRNGRCGAAWNEDAAPACTEDQPVHRSRAKRGFDRRQNFRNRHAKRAHLRG